MRSPTWKLLQASLSRVFMGVSLHWHDWLNLWPQYWIQSPAPLSSPEERRAGSSNPVITCFIFLEWPACPLKLRAQHESSHYHKLRYGPKKLVLNKKWQFYHSGNSKGFWSSIPGTENKDQIYSQVENREHAYPYIPSKSLSHLFLFKLQNMQIWWYWDPKLVVWKWNS